MVSKKKTIRFYASTENGLKYTGWEYLDKSKIRNYRNWLRSGNTLIVGKNIYNSFDTSLSLYADFKF